MSKAQQEREAAAQAESQKKIEERIERHFTMVQKVDEDAEQRYVRNKGPSL